MARTAPIKVPHSPAPVTPKPDKFVLKPPRIKPTQMRNYGKGQSVMTTGPSTAFGAGAGYGGE
jgi:hypothetical protein